MIHSLRIEGLKSIKDTTLSMPSLTLLCGLNNSGKSSVIQGLRMFCNSANGESPLLSGHGSIDEIRSKYVNPHDPIKITCEFDAAGKASLVLQDDEVIRPSHSPLVCYISSDRWGPKVSLPIDRHLGGFPSIGEHGEYVIGFLDELRNQIVPELLQKKHKSGVTLEYQIAAWLEEISPDIVISYNTDSKRDAAHVEFNSFRPANVGYGLSYCLPILAAILGMASTRPALGWDSKSIEEWETKKKIRGVLVMIENPEAHLHPRGQTALGKLIALGAKCGLQMVIETQSDHLMDGIRIAIKDGDISSENVKFYFLSKVEGTTNFESPNVYANGKLEYWPEGFFDQTLINRTKLAR